MNVNVPRGRYVLAVSGGVDSMVLLDLLAREPSVELIVAHFNHNIRNNSIDDELFVKQAALGRELIFEAGRADLGKNASEEVARTARYAFLEAMRIKHKAKTIITAHHQDDIIETALINLIRGTNRSGISAIINNKRVLRPLLGVSKAEIKKHAKIHRLKWHEDVTNSDTSFLRNYLRLRVLKNLTVVQRELLISNIDKVAKTNLLIDYQIATLSHLIGKDTINRRLFSSIPATIGDELLVYQLKQRRIADFDRKTISRLSLAIRTSKQMKAHSIKQNATLELSANSARFVTP